MKMVSRINKSILMALMLVSVNIVYADNASPEKFKFYKEIQFHGEGLRTMEIDPEIYGAVNASGSDIRIFNSKGAEIQYYKYNRFPLEKWVETNVNFDIINRSDDNRIIKATFVRDSSKETFDKVTIDIAGSNFLLSPKLYGSVDGHSFNPIATKGYIYRFEDSSRGSNNCISFDKADYRYIRAELEIVTGKVSSGDIKAAFYLRSHENVPLEKKIVPEIVSQKNVDKTTSVIIDTGYTNLPVSKIEVGSEDKNFSRQVEVLTGKDMKSFSVVTDAQISSFDIGDYKVDKKEIELGSSCDRFIKLIIHNQDSEELRIEGIDIYYLPESIVFEAKMDEDYRLFYGSSAYADSPVYDIAYIADKINEISLEKAQLGPVQGNPDYKKADIPFTDRNNYFLTAAIILTVIVLGFVVIKNIKGIAR